MTFLQGIVLKSNFEELRGYVSNLEDPDSKFQDSPFATLTFPKLVEMEKTQQRVENTRVLFLPIDRPSFYYDQFTKYIV